MSSAAFSDSALIFRLFSDYLKHLVRILDKIRIFWPFGSTARKYIESLAAVPANYCIIQYWTKPLPVQPVQLFCFLNVYLCVVCLFIMFWYPENFSVFHFLIHTPLNWSIMDGYLSLRCLQEHQNNKNIRTKMSLTSGDELIIWNNVF